MADFALQWQHRVFETETGPQFWGNCEGLEEEENEARKTNAGFKLLGFNSGSIIS